MLEPKWLSHFGDMIDDTTLLALRKLQAITKYSDRSQVELSLKLVEIYFKVSLDPNQLRFNFINLKLIQIQR